MREKPAEVKSVLLPILLGNLNVQGVYDLISGKARGRRGNINMMTCRNTFSGFGIEWKMIILKAGIPADRISEFIEFSFAVKPQVRTYVKARNLSGVMLRMEETMPLFIERLKQNTNKTYF
jgi:hypothetical protein